MKKTIFSLSLMLCASFSNFDHKCDGQHDHQYMHSASAKAPKVFSEGDAEYVAPYTVNAGHLAVKPMKVEGFSGTSEAKLEKAFEVVEKVVNSEEFKNRVLNFKNTKGERAFASNKGLTNEEIYAQFMDGRETLQQDTPNEMNFYLKLYNKSWSKVVGWTNPTINTININWKFFKNYKANEVAGNLAHEWTHKIGYDHKSAAEHDSAPYAIGYIVREMGERYLKGEELQ